MLGLACPAPHPCLRGISNCLLGISLPRHAISQCHQASNLAAQVFLYLATEMRRVVGGWRPYLRDPASLPHLANLLLFIVVWVYRSVTPEAASVSYQWTPTGL